ncbi:SDR family oxidoreductase [Shinella sp. CPCC 101442]|uniref:SDR family oxidoreductase n=1 Tax=Shinella sp. CPCC 101442 TaxID=2932265 RepID=UPI002153584E|nr:SDR family NAD(P)-dependent oxidoreductase [Shinella sp. CPCC 101442]
MTDNTILITGGTSGIGRKLAEAFHDRGNRVIVTGRRRDLLTDICEHRPDIVGLHLDLTDPGSIAAAAKDIRDRFPELNVLIANAGISRSEDVTSPDWNASTGEEIVQTNILGVIRAVAAFLPALKTQRAAAIIATSSALAFVPRAEFPAYCASKAFLHTWLISLRHQLRGVPLEVLELSPPYVQTELTGFAQAKDPRAMPLASYVDEVMAMLERNQHPGGELVLPRDQPRRWAERDGTYESLFAIMNPA